MHGRICILATAVDSVVPAVALHHTAAIKSISDSMGKKVKDAPEPESPAQDAAAAVKKSKKAKLSTEEGTDLLWTALRSEA